MSTDNPVFLAALGRATDREIAEVFGLKTSAVSYQRKVRGIPSFRQSAKGEPVEALLGQGLSDSEISRRTGVDRAAVRRRREARGVGNVHADTAQARAGAVLAYKAANPTASIRAIAKEVGMSKSRVAKILSEYR